MSLLLFQANNEVRTNSESSIHSFVLPSHTHHFHLSHSWLSRSVPLSSHSPLAPSRAEIAHSLASSPAAPRVCEREERLGVMALEQVVSSLLVKYLGDYVEGLQSENLRISLIGGKVSLRNLQLKTRILDELNLPVTVKSGA